MTYWKIFLEKKLKKKKEGVFLLCAKGSATIPALFTPRQLKKEQITSQGSKCPCLPGFSFPVLRMIVQLSRELNQECSGGAREPQAPEPAGWEGNVSRGTSTLKAKKDER